jgi:hypothetical protein
LAQYETINKEKKMYRPEAQMEILLFSLEGFCKQLRSHIDAIKNESKELCKKCHHCSECKDGEIPGSSHCFAVLQHRDPLKAE